MKVMKSHRSFFLFPSLIILLSFNSCDAKPADTSAEITLVGCTPGDQEIKSLLSIPAATPVDFIRWELMLTETGDNKKKFLLQIAFGESKPNTLGFINGGESKSIEGEYRISENSGDIHNEIYHLKNGTQPGEILLVKLSDNIFHLLNSQKRLMIGNGGWSYTLNRKQPLTGTSSELPTFITTTNMPDDTATQVIFEGRTPCLDFAKENNLTVSPGCFKLKWKLTLYREPETLEPSFYTLRRTNSRETDITGKWSVHRGTSSNPDAVVYQLDPDKPEQSLSIVLGDENVAFFLHKNNQLFTGNQDFSFTLNRRQKQ